MDIKWASRQLKKSKPVRRKSWRLGEFVGNEGGLFYCCAHEETYNTPSVTVNYIPSLDDMLASDWEKVTVLPPHGWIVVAAPPRYHWEVQKFFWTEKEAKEFLAKAKGKQSILKRVTNNLFSREEKS